MALDFTDDLRLAHVLADDADALTTARFKALDLHVMTKPDLTPVTDADQAVEEGIRRTLSRARPRDARQRFIQWDIGMAITTQTFFVADSLAECLAQSNADIFHRMVGIDVQIALGLNGDIHHAVTGNLVQHVIKETQPAVQRGGSGSIEVDGDRDLGFEGVTADFCNAHGDILMLVSS